MVILRASEDFFYFSVINEINLPFVVPIFCNKKLWRWRLQYDLTSVEVELERLSSGMNVLHIYVNDVMIIINPDII